MMVRFQRLGLWTSLAGGCLLQGCSMINQNVIDPDLLLRAQLSLASDLAIFLLENLAAGV